ncbi:sulfate transport system ATP-binding protein [Burkholderiales bacterium]|nr:MAG: ABC transporter ATP-binding protein [Burkholderiales bacterium]CAG1010462.1 sulfate transport system ATP-binding protein [Burkholderiales bacterium]
MARIDLRNLKHSYRPNPTAENDWALKRLDLSWANGSANALLGPSGCGKTTLLNIISGLLRPSEGSVWFDDREVTSLSPEERNIAQVFQFPVVYDTMSVYDNLAFPLRNRGLEAGVVDRRVREIATMLELDGMLQGRAAGLTADGKQKISLGRGLVRSDVNVIMFDEPLTVIDPHLKWQLRSKLKELHQKLGLTMIYVTHDQTEALTFADQVIVMNDGVVVQAGTPVELFEAPQHTFVGHFIGSPGMNLLPATCDDGVVRFAGQAVAHTGRAAGLPAGASLQIGVRPEFVAFAAAGIPVNIVKVADAGRYRIVETRHQETTIRLLVGEHADLPSGSAYLGFDPKFTHLYADGWRVGAAGSIPRPQREAPTTDPHPLLPDGAEEPIPS